MPTDFAPASIIGKSACHSVVPVAMTSSTSRTVLLHTFFGSLRENTAFNFRRSV